MREIENAIMPSHGFPCTCLKLLPVKYQVSQFGMSSYFIQYSSKCWSLAKAFILLQIESNDFLSLSYNSDVLHITCDFFCRRGAGMVGSVGKALDGELTIFDIIFYG